MFLGAVSPNRQDDHASAWLRDDDVPHANQRAWAKAARLRHGRAEVELAGSPPSACHSRASNVGGMSDRTWMPQWSPARVTIQSAGTVQ